mmetsp:Transcript_12343/g.26144  ORF Transcript_12343/g.26144 Transcript_12343/m.26144 type:complete len:458 (+) Transcript_12343:125-1498(+)
MDVKHSADDFARKISARFDVVCFDLDQCAVRQHSRGRLLSTNLDDFASQVSPDFVSAIPALLKHNVKLAIVTHSDLAQHGPKKPRRSNDLDVDVVLGDDLVHEVLHRTVPDYAHEFFVVAWRPKSRGGEGDKDLGKIRHMRTCAAFYDVPVERCVLFDDDATNCELTNVSGRCFVAFKCNPDEGFRFSDYYDVDTAGVSTRRSSDNYFEERPDGTVDRLSRWDDKWNNEYQSKPRFHLSNVNPNLEKWYGSAFKPPLNMPILLPLCGKTVDLKWLLDAGHSCVVGIEGVRRGIEELRDEMLDNLQCLDDNGTRSIWTTAQEEKEWFNNIQSEKSDRSCISLVCTDFFDISPATFGINDASGPCFAAVYDRGAVVAVPPSSRQDYAEVIDSLLMPGGQILMITVDTGRDTGPPFPMALGVVEELFSTRGYTTSLLEEHQGDFGETSKEYVFLLTKPKQ